MRVEVSSDASRTIIVLVSGGVILVVKASTVDPSKLKDSDPWLPEEGMILAKVF